MLLLSIVANEKVHNVDIKTRAAGLELKNTDRLTLSALYAFILCTWCRDRIANKGPAVKCKGFLPSLFSPFVPSLFPSFFLSFLLCLLLQLFISLYTYALICLFIHEFKNFTFTLQCMFYINIPNIMYDGVNETGFQSFVSN
jgi:hypothetical protein